MTPSLGELPPRKTIIRSTSLGATAKLLPYLVSALVVFPSIIWIALDTSAWGGDQSQYGRATVELFRTLINSPREWPQRMLDVFPYKPNGLIWLGQVFMPLGYLISSIDTALLLEVVVLQAVTLVLVYHSVQALSSSNFVVPAATCLVIASAPMFMELSRQYLVESYQAASVAWFILIMSLAPTWSRALLLAQLTAATAFAMSAKEIQPLFCVWPGLVACFYLARPQRRPDVGDALRHKTLASLALAIPITLVTIAWYFHNLASVRQRLYYGTYGDAVRIMWWGKDDTYLNTAVFWVQTARTINFLPGIAELSLLITVIAVVLHTVTTTRVAAHFSRCAAIAALQIVTVVLVFSLSPTRQARYLVPVLPYIALILGWSVAQLNHKATTAITFGVFAAQLILLHAEALKALSPRFQWLSPFDRHASSGRTLTSVVSRTCVKSDSGITWNVLAVDPSILELGEDWLAPEPANYIVAKRRLREGGDLPCEYGYLGDSFFGADVGRAWQSIVARRAQHVIVADPAVYPTPPQVFNQALSRENFPVVLLKLTTSELFELDSRLPEDPGILIFRRVDHIGKGRALSDRALHEQAIGFLRKATTLEPTNVEAWANLALAYEREGSLQAAIAAGSQARRLDPDHYYVNMILARAFFQQGKWAEVTGHAGDAASHAPGVRESVDALVLGARGAFRSGDSNAGCEFLRRAGLRPSAEILGKLTSDVCGK
jgi:hypothetical protein